MSKERIPNKPQREYTVEQAQAMQRWLQHEQAKMRSSARIQAFKDLLAAIRTIWRGY